MRYYKCGSGMLTEGLSKGTSSRTEKDRKENVFDLEVAFMAEMSKRRRNGEISCTITRKLGARLKDDSGRVNNTKTFKRNPSRHEAIKKFINK